jgi:nickel-dependent lactate racemase
MRVRLDYGRSGLEAELPDANLDGVLSLATPPPIDDPAAAVAHAISNPIGTRPLVELARGAESVCIVVCDITRPVPNPVVLPPVLKALSEAGIGRGRITIVIATGTHRPNEGAELEALLGADIAGRYTIENHDCRDYDSHRWIGASPGGLPVWLDRTYCDAELRITLGLIEPHFMAGYSGGRKLVMPGLAAFATVQHWHCPRFLESPLATMGSVDGNPVHEEALAVARLAPPAMIVDVTLDESNRITGVFAGDLEQAWRAGVEVAARAARVPIERPADIVVTTCAGHPLDASFYQAVKGMVGALPAVKPGGTVIIASECAEGLGSPYFAEALLGAEDLDSFMKTISEPGVFVPEEWEIEELAKAVRHAEIVCVASGVPPETLARCFVTPAESVESALASAFARHGDDARILAIPRGPYVIPHCVSEAAPAT